MEVASKWLVSLVIYVRLSQELFQARSERPFTLLEVPPIVIVTVSSVPTQRSKGGHWKEREGERKGYLRSNWPTCKCCCHVQSTGANASHGELEAGWRGAGSGQWDLEHLLLRPLSRGCRLCGTCTVHLVQLSCSWC